MNKIFLTSTLLFSLSALGQELPLDTSIKDLPPSLAIKVNKEIQLEVFRDKYNVYRHTIESSSTDPRGFIISCDHLQRLKENTTLLHISNVQQSVLPMLNNANERWNEYYLDFYFSSDEIPKSDNCVLQISSKRELPPSTVGEALNYTDGYFSFIDSDPYADLDDETAQQIILKKIANLIENNSYKESLLYFSMLERRQQDLPEDFYYYYAKSLKMSGESKKAMIYLKKYLAKYGKTGKYYERTTQLISEM
ncbi:MULTISPECIES: hypothetical protein [Pseudomonas]|uniref:Tetratricopeptide repeat protein n=1 Tax=Pseudomonas fluorescens TaxID=294 RepID=A0A0N9W4P3_PSEFL|nr:MULTISPECIES: hypothetical protein [Pseudomonas]ALI08407.1 hypothetical protein AO356_16810 [Pseudomonas fluorescens]